MSRSDPLLWEGAADRTPARFVAVEVLAVRHDRGGLFGLRNSPSMEGGFPDPVEVDGRPLAGGGDTVTVRAPGAELPAGLVKGARAVLGLVDARHVICVLLPPAATADGDLATWAAQQPCGR